MYKELLHIYGPISIYSYGLCIALGLYIAILLAPRHPLFKKLRVEPHFMSIIIVSIVSGLLGGRTLYMLTEPDGSFNPIIFFSYWNGGFSILGCVLSICLILPLWLRQCHIPVLPFLDLVAIHAPLIQSISRIGCLCAGCCYGIPTNVIWAITYHDPDSIAPLHVCLHPTQLYSSALLFIIFCLMYGVFQYHFKKPGQLLALYLACSSGERFVVDFWRADRIFFDIDTAHLLSVNQWIALGIIAIALIAFLMTMHPDQSDRIDRSL